MKSSPNQAGDSRRGLLSLVALGCVLLAMTSIWLRNRDILSDLYDYSSVIVSAGKIESGLRPYVDFRSTMQSASYALNRAVEIVAGRNYLSLTWGGLVLGLGGVGLLFALWRREFGDRLAVALAGVVGLAGLAQHVVVFYNPIGLLCLAVVVAGLPALCRGGALLSGRGLVVAVALIVGGVNKLNFHAVAGGVAALLALSAVVRGEMAWRLLLPWWGGLVLVGVVVPFALELAWTGASIEQWYFNVVTLAGERVGFVELVFSPRSYGGPTYDLHRYIVFKPLHTVGLLTTVVVVALAWRRQATIWARLVLLLLAITAGLGGVLLTVTNVESVALTGQGTFLAAVVVASAMGVAGRRSVRIALGLTAALWMAVGGYATWMGSRVLYSRAQTDRATFVRLVDAPESIRYLEGVRLDAGLHGSLLLLAKEVEQIVERDGDASNVLFGPALEWLERAYPESVMEGMPVWYHVGTALRTDDGPWLIAHFEEKDIRHLFTHPGWEGWPTDFQEYLDSHFRKTSLGMLRHYEWRAPVNVVEDKAVPALEFASNNALAAIERSGNKVHLGTTRVPSPVPKFNASPWGDFYGAAGSWKWRWEHPLRDAEGTFVAVLSDPKVPFGDAQVEWRIMADPEGERLVLAKGRFRLDNGQPEHRAPFRIQALGRPVALEVDVSGADSSRVLSGWRDLTIRQVGELGDGSDVPPSLSVERKIVVPLDVDGVSSWRRVDGDEASADSWSARGSETWTHVRSESEWHVTMEVEPNAQEGGVVPILMLLWCKGSRLELLQQLAPPVERGTFTISAGAAEADGWICVAVRPVEAGRPLNSRLRVVRWSR